MELYQKREGNTLCIALSGELGHHEAVSVMRQIGEMIDEGVPRSVILDLTDVGFMDSSGIGLILGRQRIMESFGGGVAVKNPSPSVRRIIQVAGLSRLIISGKNTEDKK